jgi:hypothetical protein
MEENISILGNKDEEQSVDVAKKLPIESICRQSPSLQSRAKLAIGRMCHESSSEALDCLFDAAAELSQRSRALVLCRSHPALEPTIVGPGTLDPRFVSHKPQERKVRIDLGGHHSLEIELHVRLPREADVIAKKAERFAVRDVAPQMVL